MKLANYPRDPQFTVFFEVTGVSTMGHNTRQDDRCAEQMCRTDVPAGAMNPAVGHQEEGI